MRSIHCLRLSCAILSLGIGLHAETLYAPGTVNASSNNYVGIGVAAPALPLDVAGYNSSVQLRLGRTNTNAGVFDLGADDAGLTIYPGGYPASGDTKFFIDPSGKVGIATTAPGAKLEVYEPATGILANTVLKLGAHTSSVGGGPFLDFNLRWYGGYVNWIGGRIGAVYETNSAGANRTALVFHTNDSNDATLGTAGTSEKMRIKGDGNVGIGTTDPAYRLHSAGDIGVAEDKKFFARYNGSESYKASFGWSHLQLGNNGPNWIVAGRTAAGGSLTFVVNNTNDYAYNGYNGTVAMHLAASGNVGIGTTSPGIYKLAVNGTIHAKEVVVDLSGWSDYVFADDYRLAPLSEVEAHIKAEKHLPGIPSATEVAAGGVSLGDMQSKLLAKVEELTLHVIAQEKRIGLLEQENQALRSKSSHP